MNRMLLFVVVVASSFNRRRRSQQQLLPALSALRTIFPSLCWNEIGVDIHFMLLELGRKMDELVPLAELQIADSRFLGFCSTSLDIANHPNDIVGFQHALRMKYPTAAHIPIAWSSFFSFHQHWGGKEEKGWKEDGEPENAVGPGLMEEMVAMVSSTQSSTSSDAAQPIVLAVVRFFGEQYLGVTCGRLSQCYRSIANLTLHRRLFGTETPLEQEITLVDHSIYGLAAGDCEVIVNVVFDPNKELVSSIQDELNFNGFRGAYGEELPRLQNLQADLDGDIIPVYRYPGNYRGDEWETYAWGPKSKMIKERVEKELQPLVNQTMNHCVTNLYRDGEDFIDHHSDKDLDLNRTGVIVSVSLGDERVVELRRRAQPRDITRITLPHASMLVLGPETNKQFTHSIIRKEGSMEPRISLTMRDVRTFMDKKTGRLFGQGVDVKSLYDVRKKYLAENTLFFAGFWAISAMLVSKRKIAMNTTLCLALAGIFTSTSLSLRYLTSLAQARRDERAARQFFSKSSTSGTKY